MAHSRRRSNEQMNSREPEPMTVPGSDSDSSDPDTVARRAYRRYEERGYEHGRDMDDWLEAERELREQREGREQREFREQPEQETD
jgi:hypothetical protein